MLQLPAQILLIKKMLLTLLRPFLRMFQTAQIQTAKAIHKALKTAVQTIITALIKTPIKLLLLQQTNQAAGNSSGTGEKNSTTKPNGEKPTSSNEPATDKDGWVTKYY